MKHHQEVNAHKLVGLEVMGGSTACSHQVFAPDKGAATPDGVACGSGYRAVFVSVSEGAQGNITCSHQVLAPFRDLPLLTALPVAVGAGQSVCQRQRGETGQCIQEPSAGSGS